MKKQVPKDHWLRKHCISHRGLQNNKKGIAENTIEAIMAAVKKGYAVEIDVRITNNNEVILLHDMNLKRTTGISKHFSKVSSEDLKVVRMKDSNCRIPTLRQVLELVEGKVPILIDLKVSPDIWRINRLIKAVCNTLSKYKGEYAIQSFDPRIVKIIRKYNYKGYVGVVAPFLGPPLISLNNMFFMYYHRKYKYDFITYRIDNIPNKSFIKLVESNIPILLWYITNKEKESIAKEYGANLIFSDYENIGYKAPKFLK